MPKIEITAHARERMAQRMEGKNLRHKAGVAWQNGVRLADATGPLRDFIAWKQNRPGQEVVVYRGIVYIFAPDYEHDLHTVVTVLDLPPVHHKQAKDAARERWEIAQVANRRAEPEFEVNLDELLREEGMDPDELRRQAEAE